MFVIIKIQYVDHVPVCKHYYTGSGFGPLESAQQFDKCNPLKLHQSIAECGEWMQYDQEVCPGLTLYDYLMRSNKRITYTYEKLNVSSTFT